MYSSFVLTKAILLSLYIVYGSTNNQNPLLPDTTSSFTLLQPTKDNQANLEDVTTGATTNLEIRLPQHQHPESDEVEVKPTARSHHENLSETSNSDTNTTNIISKQIPNIGKEQNATESTFGNDTAKLKNTPFSSAPPTFEIRTMIAELPPFLLDEPKKHSPSNPEVSTHETTFEIRTMVEELPPHFERSILVPQEMPPENEQIMFLFSPAPPENQIMFSGQIHIPEQQSFARKSTVFDEINEPGMSFEDQVLAIEGQVGGTVCGRSGFPSKTTKSRGQANINPCNCDQACVVLHNCCPDVLMRNMTSHDGGHGSECVETIPSGVNMSDIMENDLIAMVTTCSEFTNHSGKHVALDDFVDVKSKCENFDPSIGVQALPVSSRDTKITYRNIFCAQCNDINITDPNSLDPWYSKVTCRYGIEKLLSGNPDKTEIYRRLNSKDEVLRTGCKMKYLTDYHSGYNKECKHVEPSIISTCNQTGKWRDYDDRIERACTMYTSIVFGRFKNMFCFLCNSDNLYNLIFLKQMMKSSGDEYHAARIGFEALLDFTDTYATPKKEIPTGAALCEEHEIYDNITCQCRQLKCSEGKGLSPKDTSTCTAPINSNFLGHRICFQIDFVFIEPFSELDWIRDSTTRLSSCCFRPFSLRLTAKSWCPGNKNISLNVEIIDYSESGFKNLSGYDKSSMEIVRKTLKYSESWLPKDLESYAISLKSDCPDDFRFTEPCWRDRNMTVSGQRRDGLRMAESGEIEKNVHFIPFRMTNLCPHIDLPANDFKRVNDSFVHTATNYEIGSDQADEIDEITLRVCKSAFLDILSIVDKSKCADSSSHLDQEDVYTWTVAGLVSIISTSLSLFCLFLTFMTYLIFHSLRDASGKNIMTLTLTLFFAQAFFEFALEQVENEMACIFFGISIHYFWLAAVFSMNACTVERFYKLCFPLRSRAFFYSRKPFIVASVYSLSSPLIIVGINILANYHITGHLGYGNSRMCYINNLNSRIFAFALPLAILLWTNAVLFAVTIHSIRRQKVPGHKSSVSRIGIKACVQLSFVTGLTWLLAFLYEFIPFSEVGYIFTALIGLQGVLFFWSIVLNKRVIALYKGLLTKKLQGSSSGGRISGSSGRSTERETIGVYVVNKQNPTYKVPFMNKNPHSQITQTSSGDSGVGI